MGPFLVAPDTRWSFTRRHSAAIHLAAELGANLENADDKDMVKSATELLRNASVPCSSVAKKGPMGPRIRKQLEKTFYRSFMLFFMHRLLKRVFCIFFDDPPETTWSRMV